MGTRQERSTGHSQATGHSWGRSSLSSLGGTRKQTLTDPHVHMETPGFKQQRGLGVTTVHTGGTGAAGLAFRSTRPPPLWFRSVHMPEGAHSISPCQQTQISLLVTAKDMASHDRSPQDLDGWGCREGNGPGDWGVLCSTLCSAF